MSLALAASLVAVGLAVGLVSGLVGIGGGVLIVPFLYFFYAHPGWSGVALDPSLHATVAHATSLFVIVPTAVRGVWVYHRSGLVAWQAAVPIALGAIIAAVGGATIALVLPAPVLKLAFGLLLIVSGARMLSGRSAARAERHELRTGVVPTLLVGAAVGLLSAMLGVGGGLVAIPLLVYVVGLDLARVAATSLAIVMFAATSGVATYVLAGWGQPAVPPGSLGYVHVIAALPILIGSLAAVRWGAWANQRLDARMLRLIFAGLFLVMGARLVVLNLGAVL